MDETSREASFETLFERHYTDVLGYALRRQAPGDRSSVDDAVAETFLVAWRRLEQIGPDPLPWLLGVARRVLANQRRGDRRRSALAQRLRHLPEPPPAVPAPGLSERLHGALASLSAREREALLLVAWEDLSPERAARAAGCSAATFRVRLHRARRHLGDRLDATDPGPESAGRHSGERGAPSWRKETTR